MAREGTRLVSARERSQTGLIAHRGAAHLGHVHDSDNRPDESSETLQFYHVRAAALVDDKHKLDDAEAGAAAAAAFRLAGIGLIFQEFELVEHRTDTAVHRADDEGIAHAERALGPLNRR